MVRSGQTPASRRFLTRAACLVAAVVVSTPVSAYPPEIGTEINAFPIIQTGGKPVDFGPGVHRYKILIVGASWCEPCQDLKASLPGELARLRQQGIEAAAIFVEADDFTGLTGKATNRHDGVNRFGYIDAIPDPRRIDLSRESPRGVRDWGVFRASSFPTTVLLDSQNTVVERYRGGVNSLGAFATVRALAAKEPNVASARISAAPAGPQAASDEAGDDVIGLWRIDNPEGKNPDPLFLRIIGVDRLPSGSFRLEASLSYRLTKWSGVVASCSGPGVPRALELKTHKGGRFAAVRQADGSFAGTITYFFGPRQLVRPVTLQRMRLDEPPM